MQCKQEVSISIKRMNLKSIITSFNRLKFIETKVNFVTKWLLTFR